MGHYFSLLFFSPLILLLLSKHQKRTVNIFVRAFSCYSKGDTRNKLSSSPKLFSGVISASRSDCNDDINESVNRECGINGIGQKEAPNQRNTNFHDFWGIKVTTNGGNALSEMSDPTQVPFIPTLDVRDGFLPYGAYIMEGKTEFDAKPICRVSINVKTRNPDTIDEPDAFVRRLQACVDAGFDSFQLHDQTPRSLGIIRSMNENTPSYINKHWSISLKARSILRKSNFLSAKSDLRQIILKLIERTGSDALDSLKVDCSDLESRKSFKSNDIVLEMFGYLFDLQREGWIRSIGVQNIESEELRRDIINYLGDSIDFEEREGSLLLPPLPLDLSQSNAKFRMANALASGLLTDLYANDHQHWKTSHHSSSSQPLLSNDKVLILNEWAKRVEPQPKLTSISALTWKNYQDDVMKQLTWIKTKHDVSISAVALRWALECGTASMCTKGEGIIMSSALTDIVFDDPNIDLCQKLAKLREVFRFQFDEEDMHILSDILAKQNCKRKNSCHGDVEIDFKNSALWL